MAGLDPITAGMNLLGGVIDKIWPDKNVAEQAKTKLAELAAAGDQQVIDLLKGQQAINLEEAKSQSWWVAGWRPYIGWACGSALVYHYILQPFLAFTLGAFHVTVILPSLDMGELMTILLGMLGLAGMRSYDKTKASNGSK
jgi:hypothetical protein